ncbi:ABC transporter permease subunit [Curtobacterium flaccumfaciens pv. flaccumfaciens]|uniref:aldo/keto reductase n=1 Tax=Curtobacterium flaccumfaciens TaxID=2035 RepID=UPI00265A61C1|nr:aldo/keto reductase [Curtobacterium flaccumfaciens]MCS5508414.1 ABC transporter permease subunit [Curtobacterium flaccumfaciens pv. flaccumfaciens]MCX2787844.1 ABC transporter permease subunit [Curtobacterium flaccumfaciens pv. flaccumfaciens]
MQQIPLGSQGLVTSALGLGCMGMSAFYGGATETGSAETIRRALDLGITLFDTAEAYGPFENEKLLGHVLGSDRDRVVVASKFATDFTDDGQPIGLDGSPEHARRAIDRSLKLTGLAHLDNPLGVAILHVMFQLSFSVLLFTAFLRSIPAELEESARIDGASTGQVFWRLVFPLLAPMSATVGIFAFLASWNDFVMPSLITSDPALQTLPVLQQMFQTQFSNNYNVSFASYLMAMAPAIIVYLVTQRWVMAGVTQGAIK